MKRIKLIIAYDGTNYCGWQLQPGHPTIEAKLNLALSELLGETIIVAGASRTDSGVHALGNVAIFDTNTAIAPEKICPAVNQRLPQDIRVQSSVEISMEFHPRRVANQKTYEYRILNRKVALPMERLYTNFIYYNLDLSLMQEAAEYLVGEHDFKSFCSVKTQSTGTIRTIHQLKVSKKEDIITISVTGSGFLYNMVRIIVGTLIQVGRGAYPPQKMEAILVGCNRKLAGPTALPHGLTLIKIDYRDYRD